VMRNTGRSLAELSAAMPRYPQVLLNVKVARRFDPQQVPAVRAAVEAVERRLGGTGRVVLRASGTEPVIRVMIEAEEQDRAQQAAKELAAVVGAAEPA
jgi:phosphoglucosamine mutase